MSGSDYRPGQREDYITIAGDTNKMVPLDTDECDCHQAEPELPEIPVEQLGQAAAILGVIYMLVFKKPPPAGVPAY